MKASPELIKLLEDRERLKQYPVFSAMAGAGLPKGMLPAYQWLEGVYKTYYKGQNLHPKYVNECAIRMSIALYFCGFTFDRFRGHKELDPERVKKAGNAGIPVPYVAGARELAVYLEAEWGAPVKLKGKKRDNGATELQGQKGVIYFDGVPNWGRGHIDIWNGRKFYNEILGLSAHVGYSSKKSLFARSKGGVWFWPLP